MIFFAGTGRSGYFFFAALAAAASATFCIISAFSCELITADDCGGRKVLPANFFGA